MNEGYSLIEPAEVARLLRSPEYHGIARAIFEWLIPRIYKGLQLDRNRVEVTTIDAEYYGEYPVIGIRFADKDLVKSIELYIHMTLSDQRFIDFVSFMSTDT